MGPPRESDYLSLVISPFVDPSLGDVRVEGGTFGDFSVSRHWT